MRTEPVRSLALHTRYRCRHSGVCCSAGWDIPVEVHVHRAIAAGLAAGALSPSSAIAELLPSRAGLPADYASVLATQADGSCVFLDRRTRRCSVHARLGATAKPISCRAFPLISVHDPRGIQVSLSHYCPTAADLLFDTDNGWHAGAPGTPATPIVWADAKAAFGADDEALEGLDARTALPPLLREDVLLDRDTLSVWERFTLAVFDTSPSPEIALARLSDGYHALGTWEPRRGPLARHAQTRLDASSMLEPSPGMSNGERAEQESALVAAVRGAIPAPLRPTPPAHGIFSDSDRAARVAPAWSACSAALRRYLAARSVACWPLYQGRGLSTMIRYLEAALAIVRWQAVEQAAASAPPLDRQHLREAVRRADLLLVHLTVPEALARALDGEAERPVA